MQKCVKLFVEEHDLSCGTQTRYIDLMSEVGELGKEIIKSTNYGKTPFCATKDTEEEIGDCLFSLLALCCELDIDAKTALDCAMKKYETRFAAKGSIDSGR